MITPMKLALQKVERLIDELVSAALLLKLQVEKPKVISEDFANLMKINDKKVIDTEILVGEYSKSLKTLAEKNYPELRKELGLNITNLTAALLFPNEAKNDRSE